MAKAEDALIQNLNAFVAFARKRGRLQRLEQAVLHEVGGQFGVARQRIREKVEATCHVCSKHGCLDCSCDDEQPAEARRRTAKE